MGDFGRGVSIACWLSTIGNLAIISRDRYLAVSKPWWYRSHVSRFTCHQASKSGLDVVCYKWDISIRLLFTNNHNFFVLHYLHFRYNWLLCWNFYRKQAPKAGHTSTRRSNVRYTEARKEIGQHSWFDPDSSLFHVHTRAYFSINFCNTWILEFRISSFQALHCSVSHPKWITESCIEL